MYASMYASVYASVYASTFTEHVRDIVFTTCSKRSDNVASVQ